MDLVLHDIDIAAFIGREGHGSIVDFGLHDLDKLAGWTGPIEGLVRTRALSAMVNTDCSPEVISACAEGLAVQSRWQDLLADFLRCAQIGTATVEIARQVLRRTLPTHPLVVLDGPPSHAVAVYDALCDGTELTFVTDATSDQNGPWIVLDLADPVGRAKQVSATMLNGRISIPVEEMDWVDPRHVTCPAFAAIAQ